MNYYQKIYGLITLFVLGITAMILFVCFDVFSSVKFITECMAIFLSEIMVGISVISIARKDDRVMFHAAGYPICCMIYFLFTLLMAFLVNADIQPRQFIVIHASGFILLLIL